MSKRVPKVLTNELKTESTKRLSLYWVDIFIGIIEVEKCCSHLSCVMIRWGDRYWLIWLIESFDSEFIKLVECIDTYCETNCQNKSLLNAFGNELWLKISDWRDITFKNCFFIFLIIGVDFPAINRTMILKNVFTNQSLIQSVLKSLSFETQLKYFLSQIFLVFNIVLIFIHLISL